MSNTFYQPGEERAKRVEDLFATVAPRYDLINDLQSFGLHRLWKRRLVGLARPLKGQKALDLCCGTGDVAFSLARQGLDVTGLDFSRSMLEVAARRQRAGGATTGVRFLQGDAMATGLPGGTFDIVTISYGLRNLASWQAGLDEMIRLARPGGRILVLDFGKPDFGPWRAIYLAYLKWAVPVFGRLFCGDSATHGYIHESLIPYPAQRGVEEGMRLAGLLETRVECLLGGAMSINIGVKPG